MFWSATDITHFCQFTTGLLDLPVGRGGRTLMRARSLDAVHACLHLFTSIKRWLSDLLFSPPVGDATSKYREYFSSFWMCKEPRKKKKKRKAGACRAPVKCVGTVLPRARCSRSCWGLGCCAVSWTGLRRAHRAYPVLATLRLVRVVCSHLQSVLIYSRGVQRWGYQEMDFK